MDSGLVLSSHAACSVTTGENLWPSRHSTNYFYNANSCATKGLQHKRKSQIRYVLRFQKSLNQHYKFIGGRSTHQECNRKYVVKVVPERSFDPEPHASASKNILDSIKNFLVSLYNLSYPYGAISLLLSVISSSFLAVDKLSDISPSFFIGLLQAMVTHMFTIIYVGGVNQLFDYEIDKINKPYLPLVDGQFSFKTVGIITVSTLIMSIWLSWMIGSSALIWKHVLIGALWGAYSIDVPLLRWKRYPLPSIMIMIATSGFISPITTFLHMQTFVLKRPSVFPRSLPFVIVFMSLYSAGIMLSKDIHDVEGDKANGVNTYSVRFGKERILWLCVFLFEIAFGIGLLVGITSSHLWSKIVTGLGFVALASVLWYKAKFVDLENKSSIYSFFMLIWKLLYVAQILFPLTR